MKVLRNVTFFRWGVELALKFAATECHDIQKNPVLQETHIISC